MGKPNKNRKSLGAAVIGLAAGAKTELYTVETVTGLKGFKSQLEFLDNQYKNQERFFTNTTGNIAKNSLDEAKTCTELALKYLDEAQAYIKDNNKIPEHINKPKELKKISKDLVTLRNLWDTRKQLLDLKTQQDTPSTTFKPISDDETGVDPVQPPQKPKPNLQAIIDKYHSTTNAWSMKWLYNASLRKVSNTQYDKRQKRKATVEILEKLEPLSADQIIICLQVLHNYYAREGAYNSYMLKAIDHELALHDKQFQRELMYQPYGNFELELNKQQKDTLPALIPNLGGLGINKDNPRFAFFVEALEGELPKQRERLEP